MAEALKDLYDEKYISLLSDTVSKHFEEFSKEKFIEKVFDSEWKSRELKSRMRHISSTLGIFLSGVYKKDIEILTLAFNDMNHSFSLENMLFQDYVEVYGLDDFETSMRAFEVFTLNSSSEYGVRAFLLTQQTQTLQEMKKWAISSNAEIRRLASEGCRPRLPWSVALPAFKQNPQPIIEILELLRDDTSPYVRKSVANNLNDISKDNPEIVIELCKRWLQESPKSSSILKHGCRTLLKNANEEVLALFGFKQKNLSLTNFTFNEEVNLGKELNFSFTLQSLEVLGLLRVEFAIHFLRKNGQLNKKVFQLAQMEYKTNEQSFKKSYSFKKISTRVYYEGVQKLSIIVNGVTLKEVAFKLLP